MTRDRVLEMKRERAARHAEHDRLDPDDDTNDPVTPGAHQT